MAKGLTVKQKEFAKQYVIDPNATQAAIKAGYSKKGASKMGSETLGKPYVQEYIRQLMAEHEAKLVAKQDEVLQYLSRVLRGEETETVVNNSGLYKKVPLQAKDRLKAAELLGKRWSMWTENQDIKLAAKPITIIDDVPDVPVEKGQTNPKELVNDEDTLIEHKGEEN